MSNFSLTEEGRMTFPDSLHDLGCHAIRHRSPSALLTTKDQIMLLSNHPIHNPLISLHIWDDFPKLAPTKNRKSSFCKSSFLVFLDEFGLLLQIPYLSARIRYYPEHLPTLPCPLNSRTSDWNNSSGQSRPISLFRIAWANSPTSSIKKLPNKDHPYWYQFRFL